MKFNAYGAQAVEEAAQCHPKAGERANITLQLPAGSSLTITSAGVVIRVEAVQPSIQDNKLMALSEEIKALALDLIATSEENRVNVGKVIALVADLKDGASASDIAALLVQLKEVQADAAEVKTGLNTLVTAVPDLPNPPVEEPPVEEENEGEPA